MVLLKLVSTPKLDVSVLETSSQSKLTPYHEKQIVYDLEHEHFKSLNTLILLQ